MAHKQDSLTNRIVTKIGNRYPKITGAIFGEYPMSSFLCSVQTKEHDNKSNIPKDIYQTWISNKIGKTHYKHICSFREKNQDFSFYLFNEKEVDSYMYENWGSHPIYEIYKNAYYGAMRADIWRYCIIYDRGGFYLDIDSLLMRPISEYLDLSSSIIISFEKNDGVFPNPHIGKKVLYPHNTMTQWCFAFSKNNAVLLNIIENIVKFYPLFISKKFSKPSVGIHKLTGPIMFTKTIQDCLVEGYQEKIAQYDIDYNDTAITTIPFSWVRFSEKKSYWFDDKLLFSNK